MAQKKVVKKEEIKEVKSRGDIVKRRKQYKDVFGWTIGDKEIILANATHEDLDLVDSQNK